MHLRAPPASPGAFEGSERYQLVAKTIGSQLRVIVVVGRNRQRIQVRHRIRHALGKHSFAVNSRDNSVDSLPAFAGKDTLHQFRQRIVAHTRTNVIEEWEVPVQGYSHFSFA